MERVGRGACPVLEIIVTPTGWAKRVLAWEGPTYIHILGILIVPILLPAKHFLVNNSMIIYRYGQHVYICILHFHTNQTFNCSWGSPKNI